VYWLLWVKTISEKSASLTLSPAINFSFKALKTRADLSQLYGRVTWQYVIRNPVLNFDMPRFCDCCSSKVADSLKSYKYVPNFCKVWNINIVIYFNFVRKLSSLQIMVSNVNNLVEPIR
jgi:hypothetical protein